VELYFLRIYYWKERREHMYGTNLFLRWEVPQKKQRKQAKMSVAKLSSKSVYISATFLLTNDKSKAPRRIHRHKLILKQT
jgi:hypothetical protein